MVSTAPARSAAGDCRVALAGRSRGRGTAGDSDTAQTSDSPGDVLQPAVHTLAEQDAGKDLACHQHTERERERERESERERERDRLMLDDVLRVSLVLILGGGEWERGREGEGERARERERQ